MASTAPATLHVLSFYKHPTDDKAHGTREGESWQAANNTYAFSNGLGTVEVAIGLLSRGGDFSVRR